MFKTSAIFSKSLDRATSHLLLSPDWDAILAICDTIRGGDCGPKPAVEAIKRKLQDKNPHVALYALQVLDAVVKNCGKPVHDEVITMPFMEELRDMAKRSPDEVRNRVLEVIQCWAHGFRDKPQYRVAQDTVNLMKLEGYKFPSMKESDALFVAESAPEWAEGDCCHRCRSDFSLTNRRHHCRNCGQIFCSKCSSKMAALPNYGIEKEVRVCDPCFDSLQLKTGLITANKSLLEEKISSDLPAEYLASSLSKEPQAPLKKTKEEIQEEEELQLALAISQSEAEAKNKPIVKSAWNAPAKQEMQHNKVSEVREEQIIHSNGDLDKYLNRKYWEEKHLDVDRIVAIAAPSSEPSAPTPSSTPSLFGPGSNSSKSDESYQNGESDDIQQFIAILKSQISVFTNRMRSNVNRRRPLASDPTIVALFNNLLPMRHQLMDYIQTQEHWKEYYERIQEKLIRLKEAREALDTLREEHRESKRLEAEERHRMMQSQMMAKLDALRMKKREYLEYQRQVAFQQMQAQEQEFIRRKQMTSYQPYAFVPDGLSGPPRTQTQMGHQQVAYTGQLGGHQLPLPQYSLPGPPSYQQQAFQPIGHSSSPSYYPGQLGLQHGHFQPQPGQEFQPGMPTHSPGNEYGAAPNMAGGQPQGYQQQQVHPAAPSGNMPYNPHPQQMFQVQPIPQQQQQQQPQPGNTGYYTGHQQVQPAQLSMPLPSVAGLGEVAGQGQHHIPVIDEQPLINFD